MGTPAFSTLVEVLGPNKLRVHRDLADSVDQALRGRQPLTEMRQRMQDGQLRATFSSAAAAARAGAGQGGQA